MHIAIVSCVNPPQPDPDQRLLLEALKKAGLRGSVIAWNDPDHQDIVRNVDACVIRSTWDYYRHAERFCQWIAEASQTTVLINPATLIKWNMHKRYLCELAQQGIPTIPTRLIRCRETIADNPRLWEQFATNDIVVKPAVSAGSFLTRRFRDHQQQDALHYLREHCAQRDMLIQPYLASVEASPETSLVWIDGELTHAVLKKPRFAGEKQQTQLTDIGSEKRDLAHRVMQPYQNQATYGRVDLIYDDTGRLCVSEIELIEPNLFFFHKPEAIERFVSAIKSRIIG